MKFARYFFVICFLLIGLNLVQASDSTSELKFAATPQLEQKEGWTLVVIPDVQQYTSQKNYPLYEIMMNSLLEFQKPLDIRQIVCVGDLVNGNKSEAQWQITSKAFSILDGKISYVLCTGNHDYGGPKVTADSRDTEYNKYFKPNRNSAAQLIEMGKNSFGEKNLENAAYETKASNGQSIIVITLPFAPTDANLEWAKNFAAQKKYENAFVIIVTHLYIFPGARDNALDNDRGYKLLKEGGNNGTDIWKKLVYPSKNIRMVLCGHHSAANKFPDCTGFRKDKNATGKEVYQMIFDTQALGGGWQGNGGDGWLRFVEFSKDMKHAKVRTWSSFFAMSPSTANLTWEKAPYNCFEFDIQ